VRRFISATRYARIERTFAALVKRKGNGRDSGVTRRRERERRGRRQELHSPPTHAAPHLLFSLPLPPEREAKPRLLLAPRQFSPTPLLHHRPLGSQTDSGSPPPTATLRRPPATNAPSGEPAGCLGLVGDWGRGAHRGWTPRSAATSSVSFCFVFQLHFCFLIRFDAR
jgi:hypothetical protein